AADQRRHGEDPPASRLREAAAARPPRSAALSPRPPLLGSAQGGRRRRQATESTRSRQSRATARLVCDTAAPQSHAASPRGARQTTSARTEMSVAGRRTLSEVGGSPKRGISKRSPPELMSRMRAGGGASRA